MVADSTVKFHYDKVKHEYWLGDQQLPYWSEISRNQSNLLQIPKNVLQEDERWIGGILPMIRRIKDKAAWGRSIHDYTEAFDRGTLDLSAIMPAPEGEPDILRVVEGWEKVCTDNMYVFSAVELPLFSRKYRYAGCIDRISGNTVIDLKSSKPKPLVGVQLACYGQLAIEEGLVDPNEIKLVSWHTTEQGQWSMRTWDFKSNFNLFMCMLTLHNAKIGG